MIQSRRPRGLAALVLAAVAFAAAPAAATRVAHLTHELSAPAVLPGELDGVAVAASGLILAAPGAPAEGSYTSPPLAAPFPFTAVGPHWLAVVPAGTSLRVELAVSPDGAVWSDFHPIDPDPHSDPVATFPDGRPNPFYGETVGGLLHRPAGDGLWVRYRLVLGRQAGAAGSPAVARLTLTFIDARESGPEVEGEPPAPAVPEAPNAYPKPPVNSRAQWGARPPACSYSYCTVTHIGIHHTAGVAEYSCSGFSDCAADVRSIQAYHMDVNGWCDIGYNYLASSDGALWEGRGGGDDVVGAHDAANCGSMGVANMGYYHPPYNHLWTEAQIDAVAELSAWKCDQKGIDPFGAGWYAGYGGVMDNVYGHRDVGQTACPGDTIYPRLDELRGRIDSKLSGGGEEIILDNPAAQRFGDWTTATSAPDKYGSDYYWTSTGTGDRRGCRWSADLTADGTYDVSFWWSQGGNRNPATKVGVRQGVLRTFLVNQQANGGRWNSVGEFFLTAGRVELGVLNDGAAGWVVICDAVKVTRLR